MAAGPVRTLHASAVSVAGRALLILGPSGSGKSALALEMMALGAGLIADDRTELSLRDGHPVAACPAAIRGRIEARGLGVLAVDPAPPAPVVLAVDLGAPEPHRLPDRRMLDLLGAAVPLLHNPGTGHFAAALMQYLKGGRAA
jgi:HPr kinase/phosphorylase